MDGSSEKMTTEQLTAVGCRCKEGWTGALCEDEDGFKQVRRRRLGSYVMGTARLPLPLSCCWTLRGRRTVMCLSGVRCAVCGVVCGVWALRCM
jgi:hypothetical protein